MTIANLFNPAIGALQRAMDLRSVRHRVISSNIANLDTPNYKAFEMVLKEESGRLHQAGALAQTHRGHLLPRGQAFGGVEIRRTEEPPHGVPKGDGNTVDIDREMADLAENTLLYNASARVISKQFHALKTIIQGGK